MLRLFEYIDLFGTQIALRIANKSSSDRKSVVYGKRVDLGGRRIIKKKNRREKRCC